MEDKNIPNWKLKECNNCEKEYLKGRGITKIWLSDEDKYEGYPDWKYLSFEGIDGLKEKSYSILSFCCIKCFEEFSKK